MNKMTERMRSTTSSVEQPISMRRVVWPIVSMLVAALIGTSDAPVIVRCVLVLPILILLPGWATTVLLLGTARGSAAQLARRCLYPVLGSMVLLSAALVIDASGFAITARTVSAVTFAITVVLVLGAEWSTRESRTPHEDFDPPRDRGIRVDGRVAMGVIVAGAVLVTALLLARALLPITPERYTNLVLSGPSTAAQGQLHATAGSPVTISWERYSYGSSLPTAEPVVSVTVDGRIPADGQAVTAAPVPADAATDDTGANDAQSGRYTFRAPTTFGNYRVVLTVGENATPSAPGTFSTPSDPALVLHLEVGR